MEAKLNKEWVANGGHCFGAYFDNGRQCQMAENSVAPFGVNWHLTGQVGDDGVVTLEVHVSRALDMAVQQHSISADSGTIGFTAH